MKYFINSYGSRHTKANLMLTFPRKYGRAPLCNAHGVAG